MMTFKLKKAAVLTVLFGSALISSACHDRLLTKERQVESFTQEEAVLIDILWVLDNSQSMDEENPLVQAGSSTFVQALVNTNADFRIGVVTMNVKATENNQAGEFYMDPTYATQLGRNYISSSDGRDTVIDAFNATIDYIQNDPAIRAIGGKGCEAGMEAARLAVDTTLALNPNFLRPTASLAIIFLTDEDDASIEIEEEEVSFRRLPRKANNADVCDAFSTTSYPKIHESLSEYLTFFKNLKGEKFSAHGILTLDMNDPICAAVAPEEDSTDFLKAIDATGGFAANICLSDYSSFLDDLGVKIASLFFKFNLRFPPVESTISVSLNGTALTDDQFDFDAPTQSIVLNTSKVSISAGDQIVVSYDPETEGTTLFN